MNTYHKRGESCRGNSLRTASRLLVASYIVGTYIRAFFGISLPIVQVGGGIVLVAMGWAILSQRDEGCDAANRKNIHPQDAVREAFFPLTLPLNGRSRLNFCRDHVS